MAEEQNGYYQNDPYQPGGHGVFAVLLVFPLLLALAIWAIPVVVTG